MSKGRRRSRSSRSRTFPSDRTQDIEMQNAEIFDKTSTQISTARSSQEIHSPSLHFMDASQGGNAAINSTDIALKSIHTDRQTGEHGSDVDRVASSPYVTNDGHTLLMDPYFGGASNLTGQNDNKSVDQPTDATKLWVDCGEDVWKYEKALVEAWKEDLNYLLLFAGLFSTVLTGFIVPFYTYLQPQPPDTAAQILMVACAQLSLTSADAGHNLTRPAYCAPLDSLSCSQPSHVTVSTASLWLAALICSLSAGSLAITVSQWLHRYMDRRSISTGQSIPIWGLRRRALAKWKVDTIISILPLLLQVSLFLFLVGLVELLWTYNHASAALVGALTAVLLAMSIFTALIPAFTPDCPYKSPQAWFIIQVLQPFRKTAHWITGEGVALTRNIYSRNSTGRAGSWAQATNRMLDRWQKLQRGWLKVENWKDVDDISMHIQQTSGKDEEYSSDKEYLSTLVEVDNILMNESFLEIYIQPMLADRHLLAAIEAFYNIAQHRAHGRDTSSDPPKLFWHPAKQQNRDVELMARMSLNLLSRITRDSMKDKTTRARHQMRVLDIFAQLLYAIPDRKFPVHGRLIALFEQMDFYGTKFVQMVANVLSSNQDNFEVDIEDIRKLLMYLPRLRAALKDFDEVTFMRIAGTAVHFSSRLPLEESDAVQIKKVMDAVIRSISTPSAQALFAERLTKSGGWYRFHRLLEAVITVVHLNTRICTKDMFESFDRCASLCPSDNVWSSRVRYSLKRLAAFNWLSGLIPSVVNAKMLVHNHLFALLEYGDYYDTTFHQKFANAIWINEDHIEVDLDDTRRLLAYLLRVRERRPNFDQVTFMRISSTALLFFTRLPRPLEDFDAVDFQTQTKNVLDTLMASISTSQARVLFAERLTKGNDWYCFYHFLEAVVKVAQLNIHLCTDDMVQCLIGCASSCPQRDVWSSRIKDSVRKLARFVLPPQSSPPFATVDTRLPEQHDEAKPSSS